MHILYQPEPSRATELYELGRHSSVIILHARPVLVALLTHLAPHPIFVANHDSHFSNIIVIGMLRP